MSNSTLTALLKDYEKKRYKADLKFEKEKSAFYNSQPELTKLNSKLSKIAIDISKAVLNNDKNLADKLREEFNNLKQKKETLLKSIDVPPRSISTII